MSNYKFGPWADAWVALLSSLCCFVYFVIKRIVDLAPRHFIEHMGVERVGGRPSWILKFSAQKGCFVSFK